MYLNKVQGCPRVKSMMIVRLEFLGHRGIRATPTTVKFRRGTVDSGTGRIASAASCNYEST